MKKGKKIKPFDTSDARMGTKPSWAVVVEANMWMLPITCCKPSTSSDFARPSQPEEVN